MNPPRTRDEFVPRGQVPPKPTLRGRFHPRSGPFTLPKSKTLPTDLLGRSRRGLFPAQPPTFQHGTSGRASSQVNDGDSVTVRPRGEQRRLLEGGEGVARE